MSNLIVLDGLSVLEPGKRALAWCNMPVTLNIFDTHFQLFPVVPGILLLESLYLLATHLLEENPGDRWFVSHVEQVRFRHFACPGDRLDISVELIQRNAESALLRGAIHVEEQRITTVRQIRCSRGQQEVTK